MRTIRSLLWIGSGRGLTRSGMTEAPELDVTWVPDLDEALLLPAVRFDAVLVEEGEPQALELALPELDRFAERRGILVATAAMDDSHADALLAMGLGAVFVIDPNRVGRGFVTEVNETLDQLQAERCHRAREAAAPASPTEEGTPPVRTVSRLEGASTTEATEAEEPPRVLGRSDAMRQVSDLVDLAASSPSTVLVTGETGVGKEVIARELHDRGRRGDAPFVAINCAAFPDALLESELFGHAKGAFTGADREKVGLFEAAGAGTLFLDELAEMALPLQAKLLRVLQEREVRRVGDLEARPIHCRIVAATNRVLADEVARGHFREDLFYRLNVFPIRIPPLRERRGDVLPLARSFLALHGPQEGKHDCHLSLAASHLLEAYHWPGNVRELENEMLRALMLTPSGQLITPRHLSPKLVEILEPIAHGARPDETLRQALDRIESWLIRRALANNDGRKAKTAQKLGITREGLYKKLKRLGIE
ncbi:MAG: sigma 54-interacting transcriptional regulator [bacterium]|nr:sigma 54-interacting transcriptional regulator [bacterium]